MSTRKGALPVCCSYNSSVRRFNDKERIYPGHIGRIVAGGEGSLDAVRKIPFSA